MLNRRAPRSNNANDSDINILNGGDPTKDNHTTNSATKTPGGALKDVLILPQYRRQRRRKVPRSSSLSFTWRSWIPLCFVICYVLIVLASFFLLAQIFFKRPKNNNSNNNPSLESGSSSSLLSSSALTVGTEDATAKTSLHDPSVLPFPKIIRNNNGHYPPLSQEALDMCTQTLWHTIETTTIALPDQETFVHTGDIDDLWLRDSAAQIHTLLVPLFGPNRTNSLIQLDAKLDRIVSGLIRRTAMYIRHDPYANAFRIDDSYVFSEAQKKMGRHDLISTWNYELDSFCYWIRMVYFYWKQSPIGNRPNSVIRLQRVQEAAEIMVDVWMSEQKHELDEASVPRGPLFDCLNCNKPYRYPGLPRNGKGTPTNASSGLTWTGFRPSDDECKYGFLIPANMFAVVALEYVQELATHIWKNGDMASKAQKLGLEIQRGIENHAVVNHPIHGKIYAYEVDGLGNSLLMDDANVPSLLSIPYLGYKHYDEEIYANTRKFIFSKENPTYQSGSNPITGEVEGYGSPHMQAAIRRNIWPMSIAVQGLTSDNVEEKVRLVETLVKASAGTGWMHESFAVENPKRFTRSWFCWADSLFAELVLSLTDQCPSISHKYRVMEWRDTELVPGGVYAED